jgi:hypothetical protein
MKKAFIILTVALMVQCTARTPGKSPENSSEQQTEHTDKSRRWVFYAVFPKSGGGYRVSKSLYLIILDKIPDERILFI